MNLRIERCSRKGRWRWEAHTIPLTRDFKETVQARARRDLAFREGLLKEGVECLLAGEVDAGKIILRDYIKARASSSR